MYVSLLKCKYWIANGIKILQAYDGLLMPQKNRNKIYYFYSNWLKYAFDWKYLVERNNELKQTVCILLSKRLNKDNILFPENSLEGWTN